MSGKCANKGASIVLGGKDISSYVTRWVVGADTGSAYKAEIDIINKEGIIDITTPDTPLLGRNLDNFTADKGGRVLHDGLRVCTNDRILIRGSDISRWVSGYDKQVRVGKVECFRLYIFCDSDILTINGTTPWEDRL